MKVTLTNWTKISFSLPDRIRILFGAKVHVKTVFVAHHEVEENGKCLYHTSIKEVESYAMIDGLAPFKPEMDIKKTVDMHDNFDFQV